MTYSAWLSYRRIRCLRCGERRVVGIPCPDCGDLPDEREVDPNLHARQKAVAAALDALDRAEPQGQITKPGPEPLTIFPRLSGLVESLLASLVETARDAGRAQRLIGAVEALGKAKAEVTAAPRLRPWIAAWRAIDEILERLRLVARHYLLALAANSPREGQREARLAQSELDAAAGPAAFLGDRMKRWATVVEAGSFDQGLTALAEHAFEASGARDLLEFDRAGEEIFKKVTGRSGCPTGLGFGLNMIAQDAEGPFDDLRFWRIAREVFAVITADEAWLANLVTDDTWVGDFNAAMVAAWDTAVLNEGMTAAVRRERQAVKTLLDLGEGLIEGPGRVFAATLLAAAKRKSYGTYKGQSAGALIDAVRKQAGMANLLTGLDPAVRRASAHQEFRLEGDHVVLMNRRADVERLSRHELIDLVFASIESVNGIGLGLVCAAVVGGLNTDVLLDVAGENLDPAAATALVLAGCGWRTTNVEIENGIMSVVGEAELGPRSLQHAAALIPYLPEDCSELRLVAMQPGGSRELRGLLAPLRRFAKAEEWEKPALLMEAHRLWRLDGKALCTDDHVMKIVSHAALQGLREGSIREVVRLLRVLREIAERIGLEELEKAIRGVLRSVRSDAAGVGVPGELETALKPLVAWAGLRVPQLPA